MADFKNLTLTTFGSALLEKAIAGATLEFTRAAIGDGRVADGTDISRLTALVNEKKSIPIHSIVFKDGLATVTIVFSNSDLSVGFHVRELGLFAKDPEKGEILYAVANAGDDVDWLPEMGANIVEEVFKIVPVVSGATKVTAVIDSSLTYVTKEEFEAHHHVAGGQNDGEPVEAKDVVNTPSGLITATTVQESINQAGLSIAPPETDYIINSPSIGYGGKFTPNDDLSINVSALEAMIGRKYHKSEAVSNFALNPRKASNIYVTQNSEDSSVIPTFGHYDAVYPEADSNTVLRYVFNEASGQVIDSSGNLNHGTVTGTVARQVDGWADYAVKGNGSSGYITSSGSTGFPTSATARTLRTVFTINRISATEVVAQYGVNAALQRFGIVNVSGKLEIDFSGSIYDTEYVLEIGKAYFVAACYDGSKLFVYVNGTLIYTNTITLSTTATFLNVLAASSTATSYSNMTMHYVELRNVCDTAQQIAAISNRLCLPCRYTGYSSTYPANDTTSGAHIYKFDDESGSTVTDENGTLNGTATGAAIVDSGIGLLKARKFNGTSDYVTLGNYAFTSDFSIEWIWNPILDGTTRLIVGNRVSSSGISVIIASNKVQIYSNGTYYVSDFIPTTKYYSIVVQNGIATFTDGVSKSIVSVFINTGTQPLLIGKDNSGTGWSYYSGTLDYLKILSYAMSNAQQTQDYNNLMSQKERTLIDDCLPSNSISLGFARTGSSALIEYNDIDYKYMRNEGVTREEGNKRVFLGWKYFSGMTTFTWQNPFGTRKIRTYYNWAQDANGTNESDTIDVDNNSANQNYGILKVGVSASKIVCQAQTNGVLIFNGTWQTSGYIGCYAEVL